MVFRDPEVFCVPAGLLGGPIVLGVFDQCESVVTICDPGIEVPDAVVEVPGRFGLVGDEGVDPFGF